MLKIAVFVSPYKSDGFSRFFEAEVPFRQINLE